MDRIILSNGVEMPSVGLGTYPLHGRILTDVVKMAYTAGYRLFDTADNYYNEADLGNGLKTLYNCTAATRSQLFLVTKISDELYEPGTLGGGANKGLYFWKNSPAMQTETAVRDVIDRKVDASLSFLKTDYLDLLLMHWPYPDYFEEIWFEMERIYATGKVRAIGVCNCRERHFGKLEKNCSVFPMVNQFETSPINTKEPLVDYCHEKEVRIMVYSPLMNLRARMQSGYNEYLKKLSEKYGKSAAQVVLRFDVQRGLIPIPKSTHKERLESNIDIFNFELTSEEMSALSSFDMNYQTLPESRSCPGL